MIHDLVPQDQIRPILLKNPLFNHLAKSELKTFLEVMFPNTWEAGTEIMQVGTPGKVRLHAWHGYAILAAHQPKVFC